MPLNLGQKNFIATSIEHLLDFSLDKLDDQIAKFLEAISKPVPESHDFYFLRKCLVKTNEMLLGLEKFNENIMLCEVQTCIIDIVVDKITALTPNNKALHDALSNQLHNLVPLVIPALNYQTPFKSHAPQQTVEQYPWQRLHNEGDVYTASLVVAESGKILLKVEAEFPSQYTKIMDFSHLNNAGANFENVYLNSITPNAKTSATHLIMKFVLEYLYNSGVIESKTYSDLAINMNTYPVLKNKFYLWHLIEGNFHPSIFIDIDEEESKNLIDSSVLNLLKNKLCELHQAIGLSATQRKLIAHYFLLIKKQIIKIEDILNVTEDQTKILFLPLIINLINQEPPKLSFNLAKQMPICLKKLFSSSIYMDFFLSKEINWEALLEFKEEDCEILLQNYMYTLVLNGIIALDSIRHLEPELIANFTREKINQLLCQRIISIADLVNSTFTKIILIDTHPYLHEWLLHGLIRINDIDEHNLGDLYIKVYVARLNALLQQKPYKFDNALDDIDQINEELTFAANELKIDQGLLKEKIFETFLEHILPKIEHLLIPSLPRKSRKELQEIIDQMQSHTFKNQNYTSAQSLSDVIGYGEQILSMPTPREFYELRSHRVPFFARPKFQERLKSFCTGLSELRPILTMAETYSHCRII